MNETRETNPREQRLVFGHPRGLVVLAGTELWDRLSFSGMQAILVLYMVEQLLLPGHVDHIVGFDAFRHGLESIVGPLSTQALASQIFGLYVGLIYFTPTFGGFIGDRFLGRVRSVILGGSLMAAGHFCMAFEQSFLIALLLLIIGAGFLRGNLTPQVAELYPPDDHRRAVAFQIYFSMVAFGAFLAPLITGALSEYADWHLAFGFAGFGMLFGLIVYVVGRGDLPADPPRSARAVLQPLTPAERRIILVLLTLVPIGTMFWIAQAQIWNTYNIWARDHVQLNLAGFAIPVPWLQSFDGLAPFMSLPFLLLFWKWQDRNGNGPDELARMVTGMLIFGVSVMVLAAGEWIIDSSGKTLLLAPIIFHVISNIGWLYFAPSAQSFVSGSAPSSVRGTILGVYILSYFFGGVISGRLGGLYEHLSPAEFWTIHAAICAFGGVVLWLAQGPIRRVIRHAQQEDAAPISV